jgi:hypothetical protein
VAWLSVYSTVLVMGGALWLAGACSSSGGGHPGPAVGEDAGAADDAGFASVINPALYDCTSLA